jgi:chromosome partitioning protein
VHNLTAPPFDSPIDHAAHLAGAADARIFAIVNQKGGVGKTTTAVNLATALAAVEKRVLLIDFDPQGNASTGLGITRQHRRVTSYDVLLADVSVAEAAVPTPIPLLSLVPSSVDLSGAEIELVEVSGREFRLRKALEGVLGAYDYVLIDCPPSLGLLTLNALVAAHAVLVPLQCEFYALEGLSHLVRTVERVRRSLNPGLEIQGVVLTMFDKRNNLSDLVAADVRGHFGDKVYDTVIPRNVRISEAPSHGKPVLIYDFRSAGAQAYIHLASEVLRREQAHRDQVRA